MKNKLKQLKIKGQKQVEALKDLKPKEKTEASEGKSNNQPRTKIIFNDLVSKRKSIMNEFYESVDYNNLKFEYEGPTKNLSFYEYIDSRELFDKIKNNQIRFDDALKRQKEFLKKLSEIKMSKKTTEQKEMINNR